MTTYRTKKGATLFTRIENSTLQDTRLSWKARGLLAYMLSKPDNFRFYLEELTKHAPDGLASVRAGIKELESLGYVKRFPNREKGKVLSWDMDVFEIPECDFRNLVNEETQQPECDFLQVENRSLRTNDYKNERKRYIDLRIDENEFLNIYNHYFQKKFNKHHPRVTEDQYERIMSVIQELYDYGIDRVKFGGVVEQHFDNLPKSNNGNILAFIQAFRRYFEI